MTILYKLTTVDLKTRAGEHNETLWGEGVEHVAPGGELCSPDVLHAYVSPELAAFLNPVHADLDNPVLWECDGDICVRDKSDLKVGCTRLRTLRRVPIPEPTTNQRVRFAILCAKLVLTVAQCPAWHEWADRYLAGDTQDEVAASWAAAAAEAAWAARAYASAAARSAEAAWAAAWAARSAAAAEAEAEAAEAARAYASAAARSAWAAAARAAARAARSAAEAAEAASWAAAEPIDLAAIARKALETP